MNESEILDCVVIGAGPAGISASIYLKRSNLRFALLEKGAPGGKLNNIHRIDNYPGLPSISGPDMAVLLLNQAQSLGIEVGYGNVSSITKEGDVFRVAGDFDPLVTKAVLVATGTALPSVGVPGEKEFLGKGVSYCATCDGAFFKGKVVALIGSDDRAAEDALYLSPLVSHLYLIHPKPLLCSEAHEAELQNASNVEQKEGKLLEVRGSGHVESILVEEAGEKKTLNVSGVFPMGEEKGSYSFLSTLDPESEKGFLKIDENGRTSVPGLFAAGDIVAKKLKQIVNAASEGAIAATSIIAYCRGARGKK